MTDDAPARPFLELIEATLNQQGRTKTWLSQRSKVNRNTINNWGTQPRTPQAANVLAVADALGIEQRRALRLAGLSTDMPRAEGDALDLAGVPTDDLLAEIRRRIKD